MAEDDRPRMESSDLPKIPFLEIECRYARQQQIFDFKYEVTEDENRQQKEHILTTDVEGSNMETLLEVKDLSSSTHQENDVTSRRLRMAHPQDKNFDSNRNAFADKGLATKNGVGPYAKSAYSSSNVSQQRNPSSDLPDSLGSPDYTGKVFSDLDCTELSEKVWMFNKRRMSEQQDAKVYCGRQEFIGGLFREVAIKLIQYKETNMKEIRTLLKLSHHPNIVELYDAGEHQSTGHWIYIAMELCAMNLEDYVTREFPNCYSKAILFFKQIIEAVDFMHDHNIAHRDIKPTNVLISQCENLIKLSDFGISKQIPVGHASVTNTSHKAGSEGYKPPELYNPHYKVSLSSDIFSLGLVTVYLFSNGKHPFGEDPNDWSYNIRKNMNLDLSVIPPDVPSHQQLIDLITSMLKHEPVERANIKQIKQDKFCFGEPRMERSHRSRATTPIPSSTVEQSHPEQFRTFMSPESPEDTKPQRLQALDNLFTRNESSVAKGCSVAAPTADGLNSESEEEIDNTCSEQMQHLQLESNDQCQLNVTVPSANGPTAEDLDVIDGCEPTPATQHLDSNQDSQGGGCIMCRCRPTPTSWKEDKYCDACHSTVPNSKKSDPHHKDWEYHISNQLFIHEKRFAIYSVFWTESTDLSGYSKDNGFCRWPAEKPLKIKANASDTVHLQFKVLSSQCTINGKNVETFSASWFNSCRDGHKPFQCLISPSADKNPHEYIDLCYQVHTSSWPESELHPRIINMTKHTDHGRAQRLRDDASHSINCYFHQHHGNESVTAGTVVRDHAFVKQSNEDMSTFIGSSKSK